MSFRTPALSISGHRQPEHRKDDIGGMSSDAKGDLAVPPWHITILIRWFADRSTGMPFPISSSSFMQLHVDTWILSSLLSITVCTFTPSGHT